MILSLFTPYVIQNHQLYDIYTARFYRYCKQYRMHDIHFHSLRNIIQINFNILRVFILQSLYNVEGVIQERNLVCTYLIMHRKTSIQLVCSLMNMVVYGLLYEKSMAEFERIELTTDEPLLRPSAHQD